MRHHYRKVLACAILMGFLIQPIALATHVVMEITFSPRKCQVKKHYVRQCYANRGVYGHPEAVRFYPTKHTCAKHRSQSPLEKLSQLSPYVHACQLQANQQTGVQCGNHAVFNAVAVQEIDWEGKKLSSTNIRQRAQRFFPYMKPMNYMLTFEDMCSLSQELQLDNAQLVAYNSDLQEFYCGASFGVVEDLDAFVEEIKSSEEILAKFILHFNSHWTTVAVFKKREKIQIMYLDSMNTPVTKNSTPYKFIETLYRRLM